MAISKVDFDGQTLIDLTADTVTANKLLSGTTAHDKAGNKIQGTAQGAKPEQAKTLEITENGDFTITPDMGKVLSAVTAKVNVAGSGGGSEEMVNLDISIPDGGSSIIAYSFYVPFNSQGVLLLPQGQMIQGPGTIAVDKLFTPATLRFIVAKGSTVCFLFNRKFQSVVVSGSVLYFHAKKGNGYYMFQANGNGTAEMVL